MTGGDGMVPPHMQVPFRRIHLTNGSHFDVEDTSGPQVGCCCCCPSCLRVCM